MKIQEKILKQLDELIKSAGSFAPSIYEQNLGKMDDKYLDRAKFTEWNTRCLNLLSQIKKGHSVHLEKFLDEEDRGYRKHKKGREHGPYNYHSISIEIFHKVAILKALKADIESSSFFDEELLITADAFSDILEQADYLLSEGYKDASAVSIGAVLESTLRKLCSNNNLEYSKTATISPLNDLLLRNKVYNPVIHKQIIVWAQVRNDAAHGHFDKYTKKQVQDMLKWVKDFIGRELT